jgi:uncharacterized protein YkwD
VVIERKREGKTQMPRQISRLLASSAVLLVLAVAAPSSLPVAPTPSLAAVGNCTPDPAWGTVNSTLASQVLSLVNDHRTAMGLTALNVSSTLSNAAIWKSRHMAYYGYMQHDDPAPPVARTVPERLDACGYPSSTSGWGENIAYGYSTPSAVMTAWLNSPGHKANIENPSFRTIGIGAASNSAGTVYWTQDFGTVDSGGSPPPPPPPPPTGTATAVPGSTTIFTGLYRAGGAASLAALDGAAYQVSSQSGRTSWYGMISSVPNSLTSLSATYNGSNSLSCSQLVAIWNWTAGAWRVLDSRSVGSAAATITAPVSGTLADYVSNSTGNGNVAVLVQCTRPDVTPFFASGDLLKIVYGR